MPGGEFARFMPIYTKNGDKGQTYLFGGKKVLKSDNIIEAIGSVDELNSFIGLLVVKLKNKKDKDFLIELQKDLYQIMSILSGGKEDGDFLEEKVLFFEKKIDEIEKKLSPLNKFIIPGGTEISSLFHILRVICRRTERAVVRCFSNHQLPITNHHPQTTSHQLLITKYLNRLSDLFFVFARFYGKNKETTF